MALEIERKFLVRNADWLTPDCDVIAIRQFYLGKRDEFSVRIRVVDGSSAFLTIKTGTGLSRGEFEYAIPLADAADLEPAKVGFVIEKRRHRLPHGAHTIEIDVFDGALAPLVIAEIELRSEDDTLELPDFIGREVTGDPAYSNARLALSGVPEDSASF